MTRESKVEISVVVVIVGVVAAALLLPRALRGAGATGASAETAGEATAPESGTAQLAVATPPADKPPATPEPAPRAEPAPREEPPPPAGPAPRTEPAPRAEPAPAPRDDGAGWRAKREEGQRLVGDGKLLEARPVLTEALLAAPEGPERKAVREALDRINERVLFSPEPTPDSLVHVVQRGESLWVLSRKYNVPSGMIMRVNRKSRDTLRIGERLKIPVGEWSALVQKSKFRMIVFFNGEYAAEFPVGIGAHDSTPEGTFVIDSKEVNPTWYAPQGRVFPPDHPENILGTRWLGFKETAEHSGYGIHGTRLPESIGKAESNGCIRLRNEDVEKVFDMLRRGDNVKIVP